MSVDAFDPAAPLVWLRSEIEQSIDRAREELTDALIPSKQREQALHSSASYVRQVRGALDMLSLDGAARFCRALEDAIRHSAGPSGSLSHLTVAVMDRALFALRQFLNDLAQGEPDVPLKLFPVYKELNELSGRNNAVENELFFPDLTGAPPPASSDVAPNELSAHLAAARGLFQRGLLAWLKQPQQAAGPTTMRSALDSLHDVATLLDAHPGLWWASGALTDVVLQPSDSIDLPQIKSTLGRLERAMRSLADGKSAESSSLMREVLYPIALSAPISERVSEVKALYRLDAQLPEFCVSGTLEYDERLLAPVLDDMRRRLSEIESSWSHYTAGDGTRLRRLRAEMTALKATARDLGHYRLVRLLDIVLMICSKLPEQYPVQNEMLALEIAAALLFMETMLENFTSQPPDIDQQVNVMAGWLLDAVKPRHPLLQTLGAVRDDVTQREQFAQARTQVVNEIQKNLRVVEETIEQIALDPSAYQRVSTVETEMRQISGALKMLGLNRANGVLSACTHLMKLSACDDVTLNRASLEWVADGLSCLDFYLHAIGQGIAPDDALLIGFVQRLGREGEQPAGTTAWVPAASDSGAPSASLEDARAASPESRTEPSSTPTSTTVDAPEEIGLARPDSPTCADSGAGPELDDMRLVFADEADQILRSIAQLLTAPESEAHENRTLAGLTRAFHTLKGSSRLVGLVDLGQVAWEVERTLDAWTENALPASGELRQLIDDVALALRGSVAELRSGSEPALHPYEALIERAALLRTALPAPASQPAFELPNGGDANAPAPVVTVDGPAEELDHSLLPVFLDETSALLPRLYAELASWRADQGDIRAGRAFVRTLHTLKGSARLVGAMRLGELAHSVESCVGMAIEQGHRRHAPLEFEPIAQMLGSITEQVDALQQLHSEGVALSAATRSAAFHGADANAEALGETASVHIPVDLLDALVGQAGELGEARARTENEMGTLRRSLHDLSESVARMQAQLRETEKQVDGAAAATQETGAVDRYTRLQELTRAMRESLQDVQTLQRGLLGQCADADTALALHGRLDRDLRHKLIGLRSIPFGTLADRLQRTVRQTAAQLSREANLQIEGATITLDRHVLQRLAAPLEHMLRNAVAHGIEPGELRSAAGKPAGGRIRLRLEQGDDENVLTLEDDGAGLDPDLIRAQAVNLGLLGAEDRVSDRDLYRLIFAPGLSTARTLTAASGRGIGLDVVRAEVRAIGGNIEVSSQRGAGACFRIRFPRSLSHTQALLVRHAGTLYAIPATLVEHVCELSGERLAAAHAERELEWDDHRYRFSSLARLLGDARLEPHRGRSNSVLLLHGEGRRNALHVEQVLRKQEIELKNIGPQLARVQGIAGATVLGHGQVVLVLDPAELFASAAQRAAPGTQMQVRHDTPTPRLVLVVDDSLTVRRMTARLLAREGYRIATARDGLEALREIEDEMPDLVLVDIEMPRMDGFELTSRLRSDPRTARVPIVMVSSRTADKHQRRAAELGGNAFVGKPYAEEALLAAIAALLAGSVAAEAA